MAVKGATRSTEVGEAGVPGEDAGSTTVPVDESMARTVPVVESDGTWKTSTTSTGDEGMSTTEVIDAEEEDDHPRPVAAATAAVATVSLTDRAGEVQPAMSLDRERWMSSKWGNGQFGFAGERAAPIYGGENSSAVTEFILPRFHRPTRAPAVALRGRRVLHFCGTGVAR